MALLQRPSKSPTNRRPEAVGTGFQEIRNDLRVIEGQWLNQDDFF